MVQSRPPTITTARISTIGRLDREDISHYDLTVLAQDTTDQPLSAMSQITINVLDFNDNVPKFDRDSFSFSLHEETLPGSNDIIANITVSSLLLHTYLAINSTK